MHSSQHPEFLHLNLPPEQVSLAWAYLASLDLSRPPSPLPPELEKLSDAEWYLLEELLQHQLRLRSVQSLH